MHIFSLTDDKRLKNSFKTNIVNGINMIAGIFNK